MTSLSLTKPITFGRPKTATAVGDERSAPAALGGVPRANLLPPSVIAAQRGRKAVRGMVAGVVVAAVVVVAGVGATGWLAVSANMDLATERALTEELVAEQSQYADVSSALSGVADRSVALQSVGTTDVLWSEYLAAVRATLPQGMLLTGIVVDASSPLSAISADTSALSADRAASISLTVTTPDLPSVQSWIDSLASLPGYSDAVLNAISRDQAGFYQSVVTLSVSDAIYSGRFSKEDAE